MSTRTGSPPKSKERLVVFTASCIFFLITYSVGIKDRSRIATMRFSRMCISVLIKLFSQIDKDDQGGHSAITYSCRILGDCLVKKQIGRVVMQIRFSLKNFIWMNVMNDTR